MMGAEARLVKTLHPIDEISAHISRACGHVVRLERDAGTWTNANGVTTDEQSASLDPATAAKRALAAPLDFPPFAQTTVPGDRVAIAVDDGVPSAASIVRGVVEAVRSARIDHEAISIVTASAELSRICRAELGGNGADAIQYVVHDPDDENELCLVGVTRRREPLVLNRTIYDADVVLPIGCARLDGCGVYDSLFPRFSSAQAIRRHRTPANRGSAAALANRVRETDEAGWLIGVPLVLQVVPGAGDTVVNVLAGEPPSVAQRAQQLFRQRWSFHVSRRATLVIATVTGSAQAQNWENMARALRAAERLVADGGAVAICSNLDQPPGESLGKLIGSTDLTGAEREILHDHAADSWPAWQLARALQRGPVYFLSQIDTEIVEDLGLAPVADVDELVRLVGRHESCIVLDDAQHAVATVDGE